MTTEDDKLRELFHPPETAAPEFEAMWSRAETSAKRRSALRRGGALSVVLALAAVAAMLWTQDQPAQIAAEQVERPVGGVEVFDMHAVAALSDQASWSAPTDFLLDAAGPLEPDSVIEDDPEFELGDF